jgi:ketosteroid isomerase-like protein
VSSEDTRRLATTYFEAWKAKDFDTLRAALADDARFTGPMGTADDGDACIQGLRGLRESLTDIVVRRMWIDGDDAITWFELHTTVADPCPVANWSHVEDGRIKRIQVTFDPRPLLP